MPSDEETFRQMLMELQAAWSKADLATLRRLATPEVLNILVRRIERKHEPGRRVSCRRCELKADIGQAWTEEPLSRPRSSCGGRRATIQFLWGSTQENGAMSPRETRIHYAKPPRPGRACGTKNGKWLLSAIQ